MSASKAKAARRGLEPHPTRDVMIGWIAPSLCHTTFASCLVKAVRDPWLSAHLGPVAEAISGPLIAQARTELVDVFLKTSCAWLLMLDSDMTFTPADLRRLLESADPQRRPIMSALYVGTGARLEEVRAEAGWFRGNHIAFLAPEAQEAIGLICVDWVGAGALLVHRSVFEHLAQIHPRPQPWFQEVTRDGRVDGEDLEFCRRAKDAGYPIHVNADVRLGHIKTTILRPEGTTPR